MSIASLGVIGGLAGSPMPQRASETDRADRQSVDQQRTAEATERAESAAGIGQTEEDAQTSERDADGRRIWENQERTKSKDSLPASSDSPLPLAKDPSGACGGQ